MVNMALFYPHYWDLEPSVQSDPKWLHPTFSPKCCATWSYEFSLLKHWNTTLTTGKNHFTKLMCWRSWLQIFPTHMRPWETHMSPQGKSNEKLVKSGVYPMITILLQRLKSHNMKGNRSSWFILDGSSYHYVLTLMLVLWYMFAFNDVIMNHNVANPIINHSIH